MNAQDRYKNLQSAIELESDGTPLLIDGKPGPKTEAASTALTKAALDAPFSTWPPVPAAVVAGPAPTGKFPWKACLAPITVGNGPGSPPAAFLDELVSVIKGLPDEVFALPVGKDDILGKVPASYLATPLLRRAVTCEVLRVDARFESGWNWNEGADTTAGPEKPDEEETGAWQVSANSMASDPSLKACLNAYGWSTTQEFIDAMKDNHAFAVEYAARLFRFNTRQSGPANRGWITAGISRDAVAEFQQALA